MISYKNIFNLFPTPEFLLFSTSGIAITEESIKFTQIKRSLLSGNLKLTHVSKIATPENVLNSGEIKDAVELATSLRELSSRYGLNYVRATLPDDKAYLFNTAIDAVPQEGLRDAVAFVVEENVPLSLAEAVFSFDAFKSSRDPKKLDLTVTVLPKSIVDAYVDLFESVGMTPVSFDLESQAVVRSVINRGDWDSYLVVNLFDGRTGVYVADDGVVKFSINLAYGTKNRENIGNLRAEIERVISFWSSHSTHHKVDGSDSQRSNIKRIIFCGSGANDSAFLSELVEGLNVEHSLANVWCNTSHTGTELPLPFDESLEYADAIGLALPHKEYIYV